MRTYQAIERPTMVPFGVSATSTAAETVSVWIRTSSGMLESATPEHDIVLGTENVVAGPRRLILRGDVPTSGPAWIAPLVGQGTFSGDGEPDMLAFGTEVARLDEILTRIEEKGHLAAKRFEKLSEKIDYTLGQLQAWLEKE